MRVRRAIGEQELSEVVQLYSAASWRLAAELRGGASFKDSVHRITTDQEWRNDALDAIRWQSSKRPPGQTDHPLPPAQPLLRLETPVHAG